MPVRLTSAASALKSRAQIVLEGEATLRRWRLPPRKRRSWCLLQHGRAHGREGATAWKRRPPPRERLLHAQRATPPRLHLCVFFSFFVLGKMRGHESDSRSFSLALRNIRKPSHVPHYSHVPKHSDPQTINVSETTFKIHNLILLSVTRGNSKISQVSRTSLIKLNK